MNSSLTVTITGAAGRIAYALIPLICSGAVFGLETSINLHLLDIEMAHQRLLGVAMEIDDCNYPLLNKCIATIDSQEAFTNCEVAILLGGFPRQKGMERKDLTAINAKGMIPQAYALENFASSNVKVLVVANPANTNALICMEYAPKIPKENFTSLTALDSERCRFFVSEYVNETLKYIAMKNESAATTTTTTTSTKASITNDNLFTIKSCDVKGVAILGNHSSTQVPYFDNAVYRVRQGTGDEANDEYASVTEILKLHPDGYEKCKSNLISKVQSRGSQIINAQGASSGMSAANAICKHLRGWLTNEGEYGINDSKDNNNNNISSSSSSRSSIIDYLSIGMISDDNPYNIPKGLNFSFPCQRVEPGVLKIVPNLNLNFDSSTTTSSLTTTTEAYMTTHAMMNLTVNELLEEKNDAHNALLNDDNSNGNSISAGASKL
jgi:malate dehydrogenase